MPLSRRGLPWWVNRNFPRAPAASFMEERCGRARAPSVDYQDNTLSHQEGGQNWTPISPLKGVKFRRRLTNTLQSFVDGQGDVVGRMRQAIADHDTDTAGREAHTLKGMAGMIEASEVSGLAAELEAALAVADGDSVPELLGRLEVAVLALVEAVQVAVDGIHGAPQDC